MLGFVSPLPVMIAVLAFGPLAGALAVVVGAVFVALFDLKLGHLVMVADPSGSAALADSLVYLVGLGIPSWLLTFLARIPSPLPRAGISPPRMRPDELRLSRLVVAAAAFAILAVALILVVAIASSGGLAKYDAMMLADYETMLRTIAERGQSALSEEDFHRSALLLASLLPWMMAVFALVVYVVNLWAAARIARTSGVLGKEWPDIPRNLRLPLFAAPLLALALGLSFLTGPVGLASHVVCGALVAAFALQGLAVIHQITRGRSWRPVALVFTYCLLPLVLLPLMFWALLGLLDTAFSFRDRQGPLIKKQPESKNPWK